MTTAAKSRPSPRSSWDLSRPRAQGKQQHHAPSSTAAAGVPARTPMSVGQAATSSASSSRATRLSHDVRTPSPNYFGVIVDPTNDPADTGDARHTKNNWSPPSSSIRSTAAPSPKVVPVDMHSQFEAFRKRSESNTFRLSQGSLPSFSLNSLNSSSSPESSSSSGEKMTPATFTEPRPRLVLSKRTPLDDTTDDPMDIDDPRYKTENPKPPQSPSFFDLPRQQSPANFTSDHHSQIDDLKSHSQYDRFPRLSLPTNKLSTPVLADFFKNSGQRASTLPLSLDEHVSFISVGRLAEILMTQADDLLLLDLRISALFTKSRIRGALNVCMPTTLMKRPSFNVEKLEKSFQRDEDRIAFQRWKECKYIVVYDASSSSSKDAATPANTLRKFTNEGWKGEGYVLKGGLLAFFKSVPDLIDHDAREEQNSSQKQLTIAPPMTGNLAVAGGCLMPSVKSAVNPFFSNIRQNMDLIGGVGQMALKRPQAMIKEDEGDLPKWIRDAINEEDRGKAVSDQFLKIEKAEQLRMKDALSCSVSYGEPAPDSHKPIQLAGVEKGTKNRYNNIWPYDHARVKLQGSAADGSCDYINASHIKTDWSNKRYIATQGPLPATFEDFWSVVWEQDARVIVMLTAETEGGQLKCHAYWTGKEYGPLKLKQLSERRVSLETAKGRPAVNRRRSTNAGNEPPILDQPHVIVRKFALSHSAHPFSPMREITQLQYSSWPDFGAPAHPSHLLGLVEQCDAVVRSTLGPAVSSSANSPDPPVQRPVIVHCSAGCGRTGTFCTVDSVIDMLKRQRSKHGMWGNGSLMEIDSITKEGTNVDGNDISGEWITRDDCDMIAKCVADFRDQRLSMVQSLRQYVLCYETVLEWLIAHKPPRPPRSAGKNRWSYSP